MKAYFIKIRFKESLLGSSPADKEVYKKFIVESFKEIDPETIKSVEDTEDTEHELV